MATLNEVSVVYENEIIREKIKEYIEGASYLVGYGLNVENPLKYGKEIFEWKKNNKFFFSTPSNDERSLEVILSNNLDLFRSVRGKDAIFLLDVEYFNVDFKGEALHNPERVFSLLEPLNEVIEEVLKSFGINYMVVMTGQGYHYIWKVSKEKEVYKVLSEIGVIEESLKGKYLYIPKGSKRKEVISEEEGRAYDGVGRLMEYICILIMKKWKEKKERGEVKLPIFISDVSTGSAPYNKGREGINLDITQYGDPIHMRDHRVIFSSHQKGIVSKEKNFPYVYFTLPRKLVVDGKEVFSYSLERLLNVRKDAKGVVKLAEELRDVSLQIPLSEEGSLNLIKNYLTSSLYLLHLIFDSSEHDSPKIWDRTYNVKLHEILNGKYPECIKSILHFPDKESNPKILNPTHLQNLVRFLLKEGFHPKHIAGFIRAIYERYGSFGESFFKYDAATRANFWARVYFDLIALGIDKEVDFNCKSNQEKGLCLYCKNNLANWRLSEEEVNTIEELVSLLRSEVNKISSNEEKIEKISNEEMIEKIRKDRERVKSLMSEINWISLSEVAKDLEKLKKKLKGS